MFYILPLTVILMKQSYGPYINRTLFWDCLKGVFISNIDITPDYNISTKLPNLTRK